MAVLFWGLFSATGNLWGYWKALRPAAMSLSFIAGTPPCSHGLVRYCQLSRPRGMLSDNGDREGESADTELLLVCGDKSIHEYIFNLQIQNIYSQPYAGNMDASK